MKLFKFIVLLASLILTNNLFAKSLRSKDYSKPPRQKLYIKGNLKGSKKEISFTIPELEKLLPLKSLQIQDPYNFNKITTFMGLDLADLIAAVSTTKYNKVKMLSYDGYKAEATFDNIKEINLFIALKDQEGYIGIDRMGPTRIISPFMGAMTDENQIKDGIYWVWQLKTIEIE